MYELIPEAFGGGPLTSAVLNGSLQGSAALPRIRSAGEWNDRVQQVARGSDADWFDALGPAFAASGAALDRLRATARSNGVVVTTGQQPGLFGGPLYTWFKAMTALALADELQRVSGVATAPVFWAATDDSDYSEARWTAVSLRGGARMLRATGESGSGMPMSRVPLADVKANFALLREAAGTASSSEYLDLVERAYSEKTETVGSAYLRLLRAVLEPMGVAVIDASHPALRARAAPFLQRALQRAQTVNDELAKTATEIRASGMEPQVHEMPDLSLVFAEVDAIRTRVSVAESENVLRSATESSLSPNVLLRPVIERAVLPTVAYVGGPAEVAYFAQSATVAHTLDMAQPYVVPRWSGTVLEDHIRKIIDKHSIAPSDLADPHATWTKLARKNMAPEVLNALSRLRDATESSFDELAGALGSVNSLGEQDARKLVGGGRAAVRHKLARFERRLIAAAKRADTRLSDEINTARGALYPLGKRQERALNIIPFLARYDAALLDDVREHATVHSSRIIRGEGNTVARQSPSRESAVTAGD